MKVLCKKYGKDIRNCHAILAGSSTVLSPIQYCNLSFRRILPIIVEHNYQDNIE